MNTLKTLCFQEWILKLHKLIFIYILAYHKNYADYPEMYTKDAQTYCQGTLLNSYFNSVVKMPKMSVIPSIVNSCSLNVQQTGIIIKKLDFYVYFISVSPVLSKKAFMENTEQ